MCLKKLKRLEIVLVLQEKMEMYPMCVSSIQKTGTTTLFQVTNQVTQEG